MPDKPDRQNKKKQILNALHQCLCKKPFDKTSIKDIAKEAGVNHGLIHYYFKSKKDMLIQYIEYVIDYNKSQFLDWLNIKKGQAIGDKELIEEFFTFMNSRITLDKKLSKVFIEIWEIAAYHPDIKIILQQAYREWMDTLAEMLNTRIKNAETAKQISAATVAFLEGMALFSILLPQEMFDLNMILTGFQKHLIKSL